MKTLIDVELVPISSLTPDPANPRRMRKHEAEALKRSLREYGPVEPAVVNVDGTIIGGHMRVAAARELGWSEFPIVRVDLPPEKARLLNLALNRIHGEWDEDRLAELLWQLNEEAGAEALLELSGFRAGEVEKLLASVGGPEEPMVEEDAESRTQPGDLWVLGDHRMLCADATDPESYVELMAGESAQVLWTDPPYGVEIVGGNHELTPAERLARGGKVIKGDADAAVARGGVLACDAALAAGAAIYIAHPAGARSLEFARAFEEAGWSLRQTLIWLKDTMVLGHADYHYRHEPILYGYKPGAGRLGRGGAGWYGGDAETSVLEVPKPSASREHPTMKPVELVEICLRNSSRRGELVLDPFLGSGTTLLAAERLGRRSFGLEIDPAYCDVAVSRWEALTGRSAEVLEGAAA